MKHILIGMVLVALSACAGGEVSDFDREFFTDQIVTRSLNNVKSPAEAARRAEIFIHVAAIADAAVSSSSSGKALQLTVERWAAGENLAPEDQKLVGYLVRKMLPTGVEMNLPLTVEHKRSISVYAQAIRTAVDFWRQRK